MNRSTAGQFFQVGERNLQRCTGGNRPKAAESLCRLGRQLYTPSSPWVFRRKRVLSIHSVQHIPPHRLLVGPLNVRDPGVSLFDDDIAFILSFRDY